MLAWLIATLAAYLIGSVPFAFLAARVVLGVDIRTKGSGNVGAANLERLTGWRSAVIVALLDVAKGAFAVWAGRRFGGSTLIAASAAVAAVVGHVYPLWLKFKGGKGVATAAGAFGVLSPIATIAAVLVFVAIVASTRYVSLGSIAAALVLIGVEVAERAPTPIESAAVLVVVGILTAHRGNLLRLFRGTERRMGDHLGGGAA